MIIDRATHSGLSPSTSVARSNVEILGLLTCANLRAVLDIGIRELQRRRWANRSLKKEGILTPRFCLRASGAGQGRAWGHHHRRHQQHRHYSSQQRQKARHRRENLGPPATSNSFSSTTTTTTTTEEELALPSGCLANPSLALLADSWYPHPSLPVLSARLILLFVRVCEGSSPCSGM